MLGIIVSLLSKAALSIAFTRLRDGNVEIVKYSGSGSETVIFERKLPIAMSQDNLAGVHNNTLSASMALAYNKRLNRLLTLQVTKTSPDGDTWQSSAELLEIAMTGKVTRSRKVQFEYGETLYLGWDDQDVPTVIKLAIGHDFYIQKNSKWLRADVPEVPLTFLSCLSPANMSENRIVGTLIGTNRWADTSFPTLTGAYHGVLICANRDVNAWATYNDIGIRANWDGKEAHRDFADRFHLDFVRLLEYPRVVGRYCSDYRVLPKYSKWNIGSTDPFTHSEICIYNLNTGSVQKIGEGVYAIPLN